MIQENKVHDSDKLVQHLIGNDQNLVRLVVDNTEIMNKLDEQLQSDIIALNRQLGE